MRGATLSVALLQISEFHFNSHAPCGARRMFPIRRRTSFRFQLTRPMRGATFNRIDSVSKVDFNSHAPCGARPKACAIPAAVERISTHTPHAGRDPLPIVVCYFPWIFQLTRPMRGATRIPPTRRSVSTISTHTPHAGRDLTVLSIDFSPLKISTHTPHAGRDYPELFGINPRRDFNSHAPCGARHNQEYFQDASFYFNSHAPCGARLRSNDGMRPFNVNFNSHAPCGARHGAA